MGQYIMCMTQFEEEESTLDSQNLKLAVFHTYRENAWGMVANAFGMHFDVWSSKT